MDYPFGVTHSKSLRQSERANYVSKYVKNKANKSVQKGQE